MRVNHAERIVGRSFGEAVKALLASLANPYLALVLVQFLIGARFSATSPVEAQIIGLSMVLVGFAYVYAAHRALDTHYRPALFNQTPDTLVTHGPYRHVRHPIYFGAFIMGLGTEIALWNSLAWVVLLSFPLLVFLTQKEERELCKMIGENKYRSFKSATPYRLIPFIY